MCDEEELPTSAGEELKIFAETTSLVGLAHVVGDRQRWARIFWAFAFMGALAAALYQVAYLIQKYQRFEIATEISYQTSKFQSFPYITICNLNPVQERKLSRSPELDRLYDFLNYPDDYDDAERAEMFGLSEEEVYDPSTDPNCEKWGFDYSELQQDEDDPEEEENPDDGIDPDELTPDEFEEYERCRPKEVEETDEKARSLLREKLATIKYAELVNLTQSREEMIISCIFNGTQCAAKDFGYFPSARYGRCLQFPKSGTRYAKFTGPSAGLELMLFLNTDEYTFSSNIGARIEIHPPKTSAYPYENGFYVKAGSMTSIAIRKLKLSRMGEPYGKCINITDEEDLERFYPHILRLKKKYKLTKKYSVQDCESICHYETIKHYCSCRERVSPFISRDPDKTGDNAFDFCTPDHRKCVKGADARFKSKLTCGSLDFPTDPDLQCPNSCSETTFSSEISSGHYPSDKNFFEVADRLQKNPRTQVIFGLPTDDVRKSLKKSWYADNEFWDEKQTDEFEDKVRHNLVRLKIFYKLLNFEVIKEKPNYEFINLVSDLGGNTGLWVGFCVLTVIEWIVLIVNLIMVCLGRTAPGGGNSAYEPPKKV